MLLGLGPLLGPRSGRGPLLLGLGPLLGPRSGLGPLLLGRGPLLLGPRSGLGPLLFGLGPLLLDLLLGPRLSPLLSLLLSLLLLSFLSNERKLICPTTSANAGSTSLGLLLVTSTACNSSTLTPCPLRRLISFTR